MATATKSAKTTKAAPAPAAAVFEAFQMNPPSFEMPAAMRDFAEKGVAQARDTYAKMKTAAEDATDVVEDTYETARDGAMTLSTKALDAAKSNTDASFAFAKDLFGAKTLSEVIELQTVFARQQFDAVSAQVKEFQETVQDIVTETTKPATAHFEKTFKGLTA